MRDALDKRGISTIRGLGVVFHYLDSNDGNRKLDREEFRVGMNSLGVKISAAEIEALMKYFDTDGDGSVNFDEFLVGLRVNLSVIFRGSQTKDDKL